MKALLRLYVTWAIALYLTTRLIAGFVIEGSILEFLLVVAVFTLVQMVVKPLISFLLLPLHFLTLGSVSWIVNLLTLYGLTFIISRVQISGFSFEGLSTAFFVVPPVEVTPFITAVISSLMLGIFGAFLHWMME